jgi:hypothetical protein
MEAVDGIEEEESADALVEVVRAAPEGFKLCAFGQEAVEAEAAAQDVQRNVSLAATGGNNV